MPSKKKKLRAAAEPTHAETAAVAVEHAIAFLTPYLESAKENLGPAAKQAATRSVELALKAREAAGPTARLAAERGRELASRAVEAAGPTARTAADRGLELAAKARENLEPHVSKAMESLEPQISKARESLEPHLAEAITKVSPHVDQARARVQQDLVPKLTELLNEAEQHPAVQQAKKKGAATLAKVTGTEIEVAKPKRRVGRTVAKVIAAGALLAGAAVAVRQFLGAKDETWTAPEAASTPVYTTSTSTQTASAQSTSDDEGVETVADDLADSDQEWSDAGSGEGLDEGADESASAMHGEGSFVGDNPPEGYEIKGNERSMKYHVPTSGGYERTIADVWFVSEEAATAAGFTRAQR